MATNSAVVISEKELIVATEKNTEEAHYSVRQRGRFSAGNDVEHENQNLRFLSYPEDDKNVSFDLELGFSDKYEGYKAITDEDSHPEAYSINDFLRWILRHEEEAGLENDPAGGKILIRHKFVSARSQLATIMMIPESYKLRTWRNDLIIAVTKFKGTIYLCQYETPQKSAENADPKYSVLKSSYRGHKFEHFMTSATQGGRAEDEDLSRIVVHDEKLYIVAESVLQSAFPIGILLVGEIDCLDNEGKYVELKSSVDKTLEFHSQQKQFLKWWSQSNLLGINTIICGYYQNRAPKENTVVTQLRKYDVSRIEERAREWNPQSCRRFLAKVLQFIQENAIEDDPKIVYKFEYIVQKRIFTLEKQSRKSKYHFLPDWYIKSINES